MSINDWLANLFGSQISVASTALIVSIISALIALVSLLVSALALRRDRHDIRAVFNAQHQHGEHWLLSIYAKNHGKRPISMEGIRIVSIEPNGNEFHYLQNFKFGELARLEANARLDLHVESQRKIGLTLHDISDVKRLKVYVEDALGNKYPAPYRGYD